MKRNTFIKSMAMLPLIGAEMKLQSLNKNSTLFG